MLYITLSILFLAAISVIYAVTNTPKRIKELEGFSNTALKRALNGEISASDIDLMRKSIQRTDAEKRKAMETKSSTVVPLG